MQISHGRRPRLVLACPRCWLAWSAILWLALLLPAMAQDLGGQSAHWKVNRVETTTRFAADASSVVDYTLEREALSDQGAQTVGKASRSYHRALQRHEVVEAYTLKADGRKLGLVPLEATPLWTWIASAATASLRPSAFRV